MGLIFPCVGRACATCHATWQPDSLLVNSVGWTVLHAAVNANDLEVIKKLITHFTAARKKILLATRDKTGRTPLHIASFKDESMGAQIVE